MLTSLINGVAGSGKTTYLLKQNYHATLSSLFITFSRTASAEIKERSEGNLDTCTIHSFCNRIVPRETIRFEGISDALYSSNISSKIKQDIKCLVNKYFQFAKKLDKESILKQQALNDLVLVRVYVDSDKQRTLYRRATQLLYYPSKLELYKQFLLEYDKLKSAEGLVDFQDILLYGLNNIEQLPTYERLIVDEVQDINPLLWRFIHKYTEVHKVKELVLAGDVTQSIYTWAGVEPEYLSDMQIDELTHLTTSYRLPKKIIKIANNFVSLLQKRFPMIQALRAYENSIEGEVSFINFHSEIPRGLFGIKGSWLILTRTGQGQSYLKKLFKESNYYVGDQDNNNIMQLRSAHALYNRLQKGGVVSAIELFVLRKYSPKLAVSNKLKEYSIDDLRHLEQPPFKLNNIFVPEANSSIDFCTFHGAKGREADNVVLYFDTVKKIDLQDYAELMAWHVAITRTKKKLYILYPKNKEKVAPLLPFILM